MDTSKQNKTPQEHIASLFKEYSQDSRVHRSFAHFSNAVIHTSLSGETKFMLEIIQNADDSFEDEHKSIEVKFILQENYLIVNHNGKEFDYNDAERICDYSSHIKEVKGTDLSKTGYKGVGFKSLFNLSDCIYIYSKGYSFRFDKTYWSDWSSRLWQIIPIWCTDDELPLNGKYMYNKPVNFVLKINDDNQVENHLENLLKNPEVLLYLNRIDKLSVNFNGKNHNLEKKEEKYGIFMKVDIYFDCRVVSTWLLRTFKQTVPEEIRKSIQAASESYPDIYPDKIKTAKEVALTFALQTDENLEKIIKVKGLCHSTLPTQLHLALPYHINTSFILNLDRTKLLENEWNEFLIYQIGRLQISLLKDIAEVPRLKNHVIMPFERKIDHPYSTFTRAFLKGFNEVKSEIAWLPAFEGSRLLKLEDAWIDKTEFFKQNFQNVRDEYIQPWLIDYDVGNQLYLLPSEAKRFTYEQLFRDFPGKYYPQLSKRSYIKFISYLYERLNGCSLNTSIAKKLKELPFLRGRNGKLLRPTCAFFEESESPIPDFLMLNPVDNDYLPSGKTSLIKDWLVNLGARRLKEPIEVLRESILKWIYSGTFARKVNMENHIEIVNYLTKGFRQLTNRDTEKLRENLVVLTESNQFNLARSCFFPDVVSVPELTDVISDDEKINSCYNVDPVRVFFIHVGIKDRLSPIDVLRKIIIWIQNGEMKHKLTMSNYAPIMEYISRLYHSVEYNLTVSEKTEMKKMPIFTCCESFQRAQDCYFDFALPNVKGLEAVIEKNRLVSAEDMTSDVLEFLKKIGVSEGISPTLVIRSSVLKWIQEDQIQSKMTTENHHGILKYIIKHWKCLNIPSGLEANEKKTLRKCLILTQSGRLNPAFKCYASISNSEDRYYKNIPGLESIILPDELVSSDYLPEERKWLFTELGVRRLRFADIYEKYSGHLTCRENMKWFFSRFIDYYNERKVFGNRDILLNDLQQKFKSSPSLLANNGQMCYSSQLYSSEFDAMHSIDPDSIPLLECGYSLPRDLEKLLGFKTELELTCIMRLIEAIRKKVPELGEAKTRIFFTTLLEQLKRKDKKEIERYPLSLLSKDNKLQLAKDLYYFADKDAICVLDSCYLKRLHGMSHEETLNLAKLCGVNVLKFEQQVECGEEKTLDNALKEFYLERLPFIILQESKELNESTSVILNSLYSKISVIELYKCPNIFIQYPFGAPCEVRFHFDGLKIFTTETRKVWKIFKIHDHLKEMLGLKTDIREIIVMDLSSESEDKEEWLRNNKESQEKLHSIEKELHELRSKELVTVMSISKEQIHRPLHFRGKIKFSRSISSVKNQLSPVEFSESMVVETENGLSVQHEIIDEEDFSEYENVRKKRRVQKVESSTSDCIPTKKLNTAFARFYRKSGNGECPPKRLCEEIVFEFLRDHYKNKYSPNAEAELSGGIFTLEWQPSH